MFEEIKEEKNEESPESVFEHKKFAKSANKPLFETTARRLYKAPTESDI